MKREKWEALIAEQKDSGLTIADFCRMRGLKRKTFSYQKSVLKAQKPSGTFVQLGTPCTIELTLANGITMRVPLTLVELPFYIHSLAPVASTRLIPGSG